MLAGIALLVSGLAIRVSAQWNETAYQQRLVDGKTGCKDLETLKILYWGADGGSEPELQEVCSWQKYDVVIVSFAWQFGSGQPIQLQISDHNLLLTAEAVTSCQQLGTRVLLALGGGQKFSSSPCHYGFDTTLDASGTASDLYNAFILGSTMPQVTDDSGSQVWPDNTAFFDGFVFDFECPSLQTQNQVELLTTFGGALMGLAASSPVANGKTSIIFAAAPRGYPVSCVGAPSCADPLMGPGPGYLISNDSYGLSWVLLQDYLGSAMCSPGNQLALCLDSWQAWALSMPPGVQIIPTFLLGSGADSIMDESSWAAISSALQSWNETEGIAFYSVAEDQAAKSSTGQYTTDTFCSFLYASSHGEQAA